MWPGSSPQLNAWGSGQEASAGPNGTGVRDGAGCSPGFIFKSKVFALISNRSVRQNQFLEASPFLCQIVNEKAILVPQFIYMLSETGF